MNHTFENQPYPEEHPDDSFVEENQLFTEEHPNDSFVEEDWPYPEEHPDDSFVNEDRPYPEDDLFVNEEQFDQQPFPGERITDSTPLYVGAQLQ